MKPETGTSDDLAEAADLVGKVSSAKTNGEALALILSYRKRVRSEALSATAPAPVAEVLTDAPIDYTPLHEFAEANRVSYNELCIAFHAAMSAAKRDAT